MRMRARIAAISVAPLVASACAERQAPPAVAPAVQPVDCPAPAGSSEPNLHAAGDALYLTWMHAREGLHAVQFARLEGGMWTQPRTIAEGERFFANWADFPSLVELGDGTLVAHWLVKSGDDKYAYDVQIARSDDGRTWSRASRPHADGTQTEHGFVSLVPDAASGCTAVWLDGRLYAGKEEGDPGAEMQLRAADLTSHGFSAETILDGRVCDCCQTAGVRTARGALLAYRDRSEDEVRDIYLVRREGGAWTEPYALAADGWQIPGCPVNGPALAAEGDVVAAAWFAMKGEQPVVQAALSRDGGTTFGDPVRVDDGRSLGRVDVALLPGGAALVLWLENVPPAADAGAAPGGSDRTEIRARRLGADGSADPSFVVAATTARRASGFPHVARAGDTLYFAWTDAAEPSRVRMAALAVAALGR